MKRGKQTHRLTKQRGYTTFAVVSGVSLMIIAMTASALRGNLTSTQTQARAQVKQDFSQKEDAMLSALLHIVPNKAIGAMKSGSQANASLYTWNQIFKEASVLANAQETIAPALITALNLGNSISANTGQLDFTKMEEFVVAPSETRDGTFNHVNGGNWWEYQMLGTPGISSQIPAALRLSYSDYLLDKKYPIVSRDKKYVSWYQKGLSLSPDLYPDFNLLQYPDIKFGYKRPGELFVAKRNWWVFSLNFGGDTESTSAIAAVKKTYVLSIYEVPSQIPLSASTALRIGQYSNGADWKNISVDGGVYANEIQTEGTVSLSGGGLSAGKSVSIGGTTSVDGTVIDANFDALGEREKRALETQTDFHAASQGGNVGKVAFIPINRGAESLEKESDGDRNLRISPTGWNDYSRAANKTAMTLSVHLKPLNPFNLLSGTIPAEFELSYIDKSGNTQSATFKRGLNWPASDEINGDEFPFQTEELEDTRLALVTNLEKLPGLLTSLGDAADVTVNNSIYIEFKLSTLLGIIDLDPAKLLGLGVSLRGGKDLSAFSKGLSIVTNLRLYISESINTVAIEPPANAGLPAGAEFYPPLSLFAPEKRFGDVLNFEGTVNIAGQLSSLQTDEDETVNLLDIQNAAGGAISSNSIRADLKSLRSPAELPPVHQINWLVTIEEIQ